MNILEERLRMCWTMHGNEFMKSSFDVDACSDIAMYKRQADMNYNTKYRQLYKWGIQSTKALMKVFIIANFITTLSTKLI